MPDAFNIKVKIGIASGFQTTSSFTKLPILSGLFFSKQPKVVAYKTAILLAMRRCMANLPRQKIIVEQRVATHACVAKEFR